MAAGVDEHEFPLHLYVEESELGDGAFGTVHVYVLKDNNESTHDRPKRVAVKTVKTGRNSQQMESREATLKREFDVLKDLKHKNIVDFLGCYSVAGTQHRRPRIQLVMQLCQLDLAELLETRGKLSSNDTSYLTKQILEGLDYLHTNNIVHRDIKPENVLLITTQDNPDWNNIHVWEITAKISDFGISRLHVFGSMSFTQTMAGTPFYMAPEQFLAMVSGDARFRGDSSLDIYPVGVIAHELLTGSKKNGRDGYSNFEVLTGEFGRTNPTLLSFLKCMLHAQGKKRKSAKELLKHKFITDCKEQLDKTLQNQEVAYLMNNIQVLKGQHQAEIEQIRAEMKQQVQDNQLAMQMQYATKISQLEQENKQMKDQLQEAKDSQAVMQGQMQQKIAKLQQMQNRCSQLQAENQRIRTGLDGKRTGVEGKHGNMDIQIDVGLGQMDLSSQRQTRKSVTLTPQQQRTVNQELFDASGRGFLAQVRSALEGGAQVDCTPNSSDTPLICSAQRGHTSVVAFLIQNGADVNASNNLNRSPLHCAAENGHVGILCLLLQNNALIDKEMNDGWTPLFEAAARGYNTIVTILLQHGADINKLDRDGKNALYWAERRNKQNVVETLKKWM